tara:strand:+ start:205 stop:381 length:177 start_codon:yes stop_codon:yes gene_type:complete
MVTQEKIDKLENELLQHRIAFDRIYRMVTGGSNLHDISRVVSKLKVRVGYPFAGDEEE